MIKEQKIGHHATITSDLTAMNNLLTGIEERLVVRVGILGSKAHSKHRKATGDLKKSGGHKLGKENSEETNAEIGLLMEMGRKSKPRIWARSWLKTPLEDHLPEYLAKLGPEVIYRIIRTQAIKAYQELGIVCEQIIHKGFETGGYGKWKALSAFTIAQKGSSRILIDTGQLRNSVTSEVVTV